MAQAIHSTYITQVQLDAALARLGGDETLLADLIQFFFEDAFGILAATRSTPAFSQPRGRDVQKILQKGKFREAGDGSSTDEMVSVQFARRFAVIATGIGFNHALENMA